MPTLPLVNPLINGHAYSHASARIRANNILLLGCSEINYSHNLEPGEARGASPQVLGRSLGEYKAQGDFTVYRREYKVVADSLGGDSYMDLSFDISVSYAERGSLYITDELIGCRITGVDIGSSGSDPNKVKLTLHVMGLILDGLSPFNGFIR